MHYVYILKSDVDGSKYVGYSINPNDRLAVHNKHSVKSTRLKVPYQKIWQCEFKDKHKALAFEKYLKTGSGIAFMNKRLL